MSRKYNFSPNPNKLRIFQIGFNKCGTRSLYTLFEKNGIESVHYDKGQIAGSIYRHHNNNEPLIDIRYKDVTFFADMENIYKSNKPLYAQRLYKKLDRQCKNSKFI